MKVLHLQRKRKCFSVFKLERDYESQVSKIQQNILMKPTLVKSFVEAGKFLLKQPGVKFLLSERFCQDPLEAFFGQQRRIGGRNDNPTVQQFCTSTASLRIQRSVAMAPLRGNCRRRSHSDSIEVDNTPLPKRRKS